jgi:WD40 repeat protein
MRSTSTFLAMLFLTEMLLQNSAWSYTWKGISLAWRSQQDSVFQASFSPDGTKFVTGARDNTVKIWDARNGNLLVSIIAPSNFSSVCFHQSGQTLITSADKRVDIWDALKGDWIREAPSDEACTRYELSSDGKRKIAAINGKVIVLEAISGTIEFPITKSGTSFTSACFCSKDEILTVSSQGALDLWDANTGAYIRNVTNQKINSLVMSPDTQRILLVSQGSNIQIRVIVPEELKKPNSAELTNYLAHLEEYMDCQGTKQHPDFITFLEKKLGAASARALEDYVFPRLSSHAQNYLEILLPRQKASS